MNLLQNERDITAFVDEANVLASSDYSKFVQFLSTNKFVPSSQPPPEPDTLEYRDWQLDLWKQVSGRARYTPQIDEADNNIGLTQGISNPFPFSTGDATTIGNYLSAVGLIVRSLALRRGDNVIEFGVGWGHTTMTLARCGYDVTAVDIESGFLEILGARANREGISSITMINAEFLDGVVTS